MQALFSFKQLMLFRTSCPVMGKLISKLCSETLVRSNCGNVLSSEDMVFNFLKCSANASRDNFWAVAVLLPLYLFNNFQYAFGSEFFKLLSLFDIYHLVQDPENLVPIVSQAISIRISVLDTNPEGVLPY